MCSNFWHLQLLSKNKFSCVEKIKTILKTKLLTKPHSRWNSKFCASSSPASAWPLLLNPRSFTTSTGMRPTLCSGWTTPTTLLMSTLVTNLGNMTKPTSFAPSPSLASSTLRGMSSTASAVKSLTPAASPILSQRLLPSATSHTDWCTLPSPSDHSHQLLVASSSTLARITTSSPLPHQRIFTGVLEEAVPPITWRWSLEWPTTESPKAKSSTISWHQLNRPPQRQPRWVRVLLPSKRFDCSGGEQHRDRDDQQTEQLRQGHRHQHMEEGGTEIHQHQFFNVERWLSFWRRSGVADVTVVLTEQFLKTNSAPRLFFLLRNQNPCLLSMPKNFCNTYLALVLVYYDLLFSFVLSSFCDKILFIL